MFKLTYRRKITSTVRTDDHKSLNESNLTVHQQCKAPITSYI